MRGHDPRMAHQQQNSSMIWVCSVFYGASERAALRPCCNQSRSKYGQLTRPRPRADPASQNAGRINAALR